MNHFGVIVSPNDLESIGKFCRNESCISIKLVEHERSNIERTKRGAVGLNNEFRPRTTTVAATPDQDPWTLNEQGFEIG